MLKMFENVGSRLLERFVPSIDASAAAPCYKCFTGSGCDAWDNHWWSYSENCSTGWRFVECDNCR